MAQVQNIWNLVRHRFPEGQYALMEEVSDAAGFSRSRSADYIAVGLWPSRGLAINGIELKSFRSDWLGELKKPEKQEAIFKYCDYFWLLTTDDTIAKAEEIPINWGWLCVKGDRIITKKEAPKLEPAPISKHFMAAMLKRATGPQMVHISQIQNKINAAKEENKKHHEKIQEHLQSDLDSARQVIQDFEQGSGIVINGWRSWDTPKAVGAAVKMVLAGGLKDYERQLSELQDRARRIHENINQTLSAAAEKALLLSVSSDQ